MNTDYGISTLDPTIGLLRKELEVNNVPPGQEAQYFQSKGRPLSPQLVFLIQANKKLQESAQAAQAQPPQSTVADDLSAALVQKANQGVANLMQQRMPIRDQGVATLPADVGSDKAYAGGGIVAFNGEKDSYVGPKVSDVTVSGFGPIADFVGGIPGFYGDLYGTYYDILRNTARGAKEGLKGMEIAPGRRIPYYGMAVSPDDVEALRKYREKPAANAPTYPTPALPFNVTGDIRTPGINPNVPLPPLPSGRGTGAGGTRGGVSASAGQKANVPVSPYQADIDKYMAEIRRRAGETPEQYAARLEAIDKAAGLTEAEQKRLDRLTGRRRELEDDDKKSAEEEKREKLYRFTEAALSSVGDPRATSLVRGLGLTGASFVKGASEVEGKFKAERKERKKVRAAIEDAQDTLAEAQAARRAGRYKEADELQQKYYKALYDAGIDARGNALEERKAEAQIAQYRAASRIPYREQMEQEINSVARQVMDLRRRGKNREADALEKENEYRTRIYQRLIAPGQELSAEGALQRAQLTAFQKDPNYKRMADQLYMEKLILGTAESTGNKNAANAQRAKIAQIEAQIARLRDSYLADGGEGAPAGSSGTGRVSDMSDDQIKRALGLQ